MGRNALKSLSDITNNYSFVLIDTCALLNPIWYHSGRNTIYDTTNKILENVLFREKLFDSIKKGVQIFLTNEVAEEYSERVIFNYNRAIKRLSSSSVPGKIRKQRLELCRLRKKTKNGRRNLIDFFRENNRILDLSERYPKEYNKFEKQSLDIAKKYGLSKVDLNLILYSFLLEEKLGSSALLSNDFGIIKAKKEIINSRNDIKKHLNIFIREKEDLFIQAY